MSEHVNALVYAMLSNQTKWYRIEPHLAKIDKVFFYYDINQLKATPGEYFANKIFQLKCGNISTKAQMKALAYNISVLESIESVYGSIDNFVLSAPAFEIAQAFFKNNSKYKLKMIGEALAWEYLRNVGIDGANPNGHLCRFFSGGRMGNGNCRPATSNEVYNSVLELSKLTGLSMFDIDNCIWSYCADEYGAVCTANPHCYSCDIKKYCNQNI